MAAGFAFDFGGKKDDIGNSRSRSKGLPGDQKRGRRPSFGHRSDGSRTEGFALDVGRTRDGLQTSGDRYCSSRTPTLRESVALLGVCLTPAPGYRSSRVARGRGSGGYRRHPREDRSSPFVRGSPSFSFI